MKKYLFIFKAELMSTLQYIGNILMNSVSYFVIIFIFIYLWNYIYDDPSQLINGYSKGQMIWYVIITEILWKIFDGRKFCRRIINDIKTGNIAYNINRPYNYIGYCLSTHIGEGTVRGIIYIIIGIVLGKILLGSLPSLSIISVLIILLSSLFATIIDALFIILIGLFALYIEDSKPIYWIYSKLMLLLGIIFPVEFFPRFLQKIIAISPIYVTCYGPAKLFVNFSIESAIQILIAQILYIMIALSICTFIYSKGVRKLNVNGG